MAASSSSGSDCKIEDAKQKGEVQGYAEIVVVLHGECDWNAPNTKTELHNVKMNDKGSKQALAVAKRLANDRKITAVYSSNWIRAIDTAFFIASKCKIYTFPRDHDLRGRYLAMLQGEVRDERKDEEITVGSESFDQLYQRCTSKLRKIAGKHIGERVVVVTHGEVLRAFHKMALPAVERPGNVRNASLSIFRFAVNGSLTIEAWDDVSHLTEVGLL